MEHLISVADTSILEIEPYSDATVNEVIDEFAKDTPSELELLATSLYVYFYHESVDIFVIVRHYRCHRFVTGS